VNNQDRRLDGSKLRRSVILRPDGNQLAPHALRVEATVETCSHLLAGPRFIKRKTAPGNHFEELGHMLNVGFPLGWGTGNQCRCDFGFRLRKCRISRVRVYGDQTRHPGRMPKGDRLGDGSSHRRAADMGGRNSEPGQKCRTVVRHVLYGIGHTALVAFRYFSQRFSDPCFTGMVEFGGESGIPVIVSDDIMTAIRKIPAEVFIPMDHLSPQSGDQQQRTV